MQLARAFSLLVALALLSLSSLAAADDVTDGGAAPAPVAPAPEPAPAASAAIVANAPEPDGEANANAEANAAAPASSSNVNARASLEIGGYVDSTATSVLTPSVAATVENPTAGWGISGRYLVDVVSAASPDIVSTASPRWSEVRNAGNLGLRYKPGTTGVAVNAATSYTPDYLSLSASAQVTQDLDEKNLTLVGGYGFGHDVIGRARTPFSVFSRTLDYHSLSLGLSRVVNPSLVVGVYGDAIIERGDQSKPYRYIPMFAPDVASRVGRGASAGFVSATRLDTRPLEQLPLERERYAVTGRLAYRGNGTTLRLDERLYGDTWGQRASTTDARYFIDLGRRFTVWPHGRFNIQSAVDFWQRTYTSTGVNDLPALRTGDRELGALFTVGGGGGLRIALGKAGALDDIVLTTTLDGYWTSFADTLYVTERFSALATTALEVAF
jgi:hypothetical protein